MWQQLRGQISEGDIRQLARAISLVENEHEGYEEFLASLPHQHKAKIIGITGPPGAGKSTLVDALITEITKNDKKVAVLCVDPSSPFNLGAVLGDRIRMSQWYTHSSVFIRSLATRGSLGGLHPRIIEITDVVQAAGFDFIIVETVGVGQSEIEIAGLADTTIVVVVPEAGDEVQTMKAGLMEIADAFVVNKADRDGADEFVKNLRLMLAPAFKQVNEIPVIKTVANTGEGVAELYKLVDSPSINDHRDRKLWLLTEKAYELIRRDRMKDLSRAKLYEEIGQASDSGNFNLYRFVQKKIAHD